MVQITRVVREPKEKVGEEFIPSNNCCGKCFYNIPKGTILLLLPAVTMLCIGITTTILDKDGHWREGLMHIGILFLALGGILSFVVVFFCVRSWCRRQPEWFKLPEPASHHHGNDAGLDHTDSDVQLTGIFRTSAEFGQTLGNNVA